MKRKFTNSHTSEPADRIEKYIWRTVSHLVKHCTSKSELVHWNPGEVSCIFAKPTGTDSLVPVSCLMNKTTRMLIETLVVMQIWAILFLFIWEVKRLHKNWNADVMRGTRCSSIWFLMWSLRWLSLLVSTYVEKDTSQSRSNCFWWEKHFKSMMRIILVLFSFLLLFFPFDIRPPLVCYR